ncbi:hypothetical protein QYF36_018310 [Acer negundo]|nr:hypothetical protein QYF36_018310 [Acer negundo]
MSQAVISIERLENYMKSGELKEDSVEREEGCSGNISVEVKDRTFSWEDEGGEEVMRDEMIVQSGKYEELLNSGMDFGALVAAHETSIKLDEMNNNATSGDTLQQKPKSPHRSLSREKSTGENRSLYKSKSEGISSSKLIEDEERETGHVSLDVYKQYCTQAFGWWAVASVILTSLFWQACLMASDFWLAYETSEARTFIPSLFIIVYAIIAVVSAIFVAIKSFLVAFLSLRTAQSFLNQLLSSILHAPMSFFDTTPSGRLLTRVSTDQANVDLYVPMYLSLVIVMFFKENINKPNANLQMDFHNNALTEWLGFRLELIGSVALCIATLLMILLPSSIIKPENRMVSVERIKQFTKIPSEPAWKTTGRTRKEFDKPSNLLERTSLFAALVQEYANRSSGL